MGKNKNKSILRYAEKICPNWTQVTN